MKHTLILDTAQLRIIEAALAAARTAPNGAIDPDSDALADLADGVAAAVTAGVHGYTVHTLVDE